MKARPAGHRVIVKPDEYDATTSGGIIIPDVDKRKQQAQIKGRIIAVGPQAWKDFSNGEPWAKEGDHVYFAKYGGAIIEEDGIDYRLLNDEDITAVIDDE